MKPGNFCLVRTVEYFAVYPSGRRCLVTRESVEKCGPWWALEGVSIETHVKVENVPIYGTQVLIP